MYETLFATSHKKFLQLNLAGVAGYDHHCPWMGTCIGEKNRGWFLVYITAQYYEVSWTSGMYVVKTIEHWEEIKESWWMIFAEIFLGIGLLFFFLFLSSLVFYHFYLISVNLSTWEDKSWKKISYLKEFSKRFGSPFSKGALWNWNHLFLKRILGRNRFVLWTFTEDFKKKTGRKFA